MSTTMYSLCMHCAIELCGSYINQEILVSMANNWTVASKRIKVSWGWDPRDPEEKWIISFTIHLLPPNKSCIVPQLPCCSTAHCSTFYCSTSYCSVASSWDGLIFGKIRAKDGRFFSKNTGVRRAKRQAKFKYRPSFAAFSYVTARSGRYCKSQTAHWH